MGTTSDSVPALASPPPQALPGRRPGRPLAGLLIPAVSTLGELFMPPICLHCEGRRFRATPLCLGCLRKLRPLPPDCCPRCGEPDCGRGGDDGRAALQDGARADSHAYWPHAFASARFLYPVTPQLSTLVHGFKYRHLRRHVEFLAAPLRRRGDLLAYARGFDALVPVPLHPARRRERGYNQAEAIAEALGRRCGVPVLPGALRRLKATGTQTRLGKDARRANLEGAFACPDPGAVEGRRLLIVDDVFTTGSTASACARALLGAGCSEAGVFALGKVGNDRPQDDFVKEMELVASYLA